MKNSINQKWVVGNMRGFATLEILIALAVFSLGIASVVTISLGSQEVTSESAINHEAIYEAKAMLEGLRATAESDFEALESATSTDGFYDKEIVVSDVTPYSKEVTGTIGWSVGNRPQELSFSTVLTALAEVAAVTGDVGGETSDESWDTVRACEGFEVTEGIAATDIDAENNFLFLSVKPINPTNTGANDLYVLEASKKNRSVTYKGSLKISDGGINAIDSAGKAYLYAANNATSSQLLVINAPKSGSLSLVASSTLSEVSGDTGVGSAIFYHKKKIYIGTRQTSGPEFHVFDVSDPTSPQELGSFEVDADVNAIQIRGGFAYVATSHDEKELIILDVSDPDEITEADSFDAEGDGDGTSVAYQGKRIALGRLAGADTDEPEAYFLDFRGDEVSEISSYAIGADVNDLLLIGNRAFLATADTDKDIQVLNIKKITAVKNEGHKDLSKPAVRVDYEHKRLYTAQSAQEIVRVVEPGVCFSISSENELQIDEDFKLQVSVIGAELMNASGTYNLPITVSVKVDGDTFEPWGDYDKAVSGNVNDANNPREYVLSDLYDAGAQISIKAKSWKKKNENSSGAGNGDWEKLYERNSAGSNSKVKIVRDGSDVPNLADYVNEFAIKKFLKPLTKNGKISIGSNDILFLFELSTNSTDPDDIDYQDLVIRVSIIRE